MSHILIEFDLAGAEWVVVAYLSGDENMLGVVESGKSPHIVTGALISGLPEDLVQKDHEVVGNNTGPDTVTALRADIKFPDGHVDIYGKVHGVFIPRSMSIRQMGKKSNHGLNYYMRYRRAAMEWEISEKDAEPIVELYSKKAYPGLQDYWADTRKIMKDNKRCLTNCFGRKVCMMGEWGVELYMAAYSFRPQSTVFDICRRGMIGAYNDNSLNFINMKLGAQVHDSVMMNYPIPQDKDGWYVLCEFLDRMTNVHLHQPIAYTDPKGITRDFVLGVDTKMGHNWGVMHSVKVTQHYDDMIEVMQSLLDPQSQEASVASEPEWEPASVPLGPAPPSELQDLGTEG